MFMNIKIYLALLMTVATNFIGCTTHEDDSSQGSTIKSDSVDLGANLFDVVTQCSPSPLGFYWFCKDKEFNVYPQTLIITDSDLLKKVGIQNELQYTFKCSSSSPIIAKIGGLGSVTLDQEIAATKDDSPKAITFDISSLNDGLKIRIYDPSPNHTAVVTDDCAFKIVGNQTRPNMVQLKKLIEDYEKNIRDAAESRAGFELLSSLVPAFNLVKNVNKHIEDDLAKNKLIIEEIKKLNSVPSNSSPEVDSPLETVAFSENLGFTPEEKSAALRIKSIIELIPDSAVGDNINFSSMLGAKDIEILKNIEIKLNKAPDALRQFEYFAKKYEELSNEIAALKIQFKDYLVNI